MSNEENKTIELQLYIAIEYTGPSSELEVTSETDKTIEEALTDLLSKETAMGKTVQNVYCNIKKEENQKYAAKGPTVGMRFIDKDTGVVMMDHRRQYEP